MIAIESKETTVERPAVNIPPVRTIPANELALWKAFRTALLLMVDAIEVYTGAEVRTSELRKRAR